MMLQRRPQEPFTLAGVEASRAFFQPWFKNQQPNLLWVAHVDERARCIHVTSHEFAEEAAKLPIAEIVRDAARTGSAGLILARQQAAGGTVLPSKLGLETRALADAAEVIGVTVLDHLLFSGGTCSSMRRAGTL